jgi:3-mercaptopyruvate sulfurtransferase SseA
MLMLQPTTTAAAAAVCRQGAVFFTWTKDAVDASAGAPVQLQMQPDLLAAALEAKGVSGDKPVVVSESAVVVDVCLVCSGSLGCFVAH